MTKRNNLFAENSKKIAFPKLFALILGLLFFQFIACDSETKNQSEETKTENIEPPVTDKPKLVSIKIKDPCPPELSCHPGKGSDLPGISYCGADSLKKTKHPVDLEFERWVSNLNEVVSIEFASLHPEEGKPNLHRSILSEMSKDPSKNIIRGELMFCRGIDSTECHGERLMIVTALTGKNSEGQPILFEVTPGAKIYCDLNGSE